MVYGLEVPHPCPTGHTYLQVLACNIHPTSAHSPHITRHLPLTPLSNEFYSWHLAQKWRWGTTWRTRSIGGKGPTAITADHINWPHQKLQYQSQDICLTAHNSVRSQEADWFCQLLEIPTLPNLILHVLVNKHSHSFFFLFKNADFISDVTMMIPWLPLPLLFWICPLHCVMIKGGDGSCKS